MLIMCKAKEVSHQSSVIHVLWVQVISASTDGWQFPNVDTALPSSKEAC